MLNLLLYVNILWSEMEPSADVEVNISLESCLFVLFKFRALINLSQFHIIFNKIMFSANTICHSDLHLGLSCWNVQFLLLSTVTMGMKD